MSSLDHEQRERHDRLFKAYWAARTLIRDLTYPDEQKSLIAFAELAMVLIRRATKDESYSPTSELEHFVSDQSIIFRAYDAVSADIEPFEDEPDIINQSFFTVAKKLLDDVVTFDRPSHN